MSTTTIPTNPVNTIIHNIQKETVTHNIVAICRESGMSAQGSFDHIGKMLTTCYRDWYLALAELPTWGEAVDAHVQGYIRGVQNVVQANLHWRYVHLKYGLYQGSTFDTNSCCSVSFRSGRYFGRDNERVRRSGVVYVRPRSADLII